MANPTILDYRVYVLRCWRELVPEGGTHAPRISLEDPNTGHRHGFTRVVDLVEFLERSLMYDGPTDASTRTTLRHLPSKPDR